MKKAKPPVTDADITSQLWAIADAAEEHLAANPDVRRGEEIALREEIDKLRQLLKRLERQLRREGKL